MATAHLRDISIAYDDHGHGQDVLLLIHGHPFNRTMWRHQVQVVADTRWRVIVPDLRGYGETTVVPGTTPLYAFADDLVALLDHLGVRGAVVGGLSMGGQIVMELLHRYPQRVRGVILAATFAQAETIEGRRTRNAVADRILHEGMDHYAAELLPGMLAPRSMAGDPTMADAVASMMRATDPQGAAAALRGRAERPSYDATLARAAVPALVVVGSEDAFTTRDDAERMHGLIQGSELLLLDGAGHMPNLEQPERFNAALVGFLARVGGSGSREAGPSALPEA